MLAFALSPVRQSVHVGVRANAHLPMRFAMLRDKQENGKFYLAICIIISIYAFSISI